MEFENHKLEWIEYDLLEGFKNIKHATILRHGGVSTKHFSSMNLGDHVGDNPENVKTNRQAVKDFMGVSTIVYPHQTHGTDVAVITKKDKKVNGVDALITNETDIGLAVCHADCQAALFYDSEHHVIGVAHAGYKGLVNNIYKNVIDTMHNTFGTRPENLIVCISASLGPEHAEYKNYKEEFPEELWSYQKENHFNLWDIAKKLLTEAGVHESNIEINEVCTFCNEKDYFSYRREKETGRHATIIALKS